MFEVTLMTATHDFFKGKPNDEIAAWVAKQLDDCGFKTVPMGASWGVLQDEA